MHILSLRSPAWIGAKAIILPTCSEIVTGAVFGAGSVVTSNVPDHTN
ncbi:MAG: hypothetical protein ACR2O3_10085 [Rhizobiaceae bacterium]